MTTFIPNNLLINILISQISQYIETTIRLLPITVLWIVYHFSDIMIHKSEPDQHLQHHRKVRILLSKQLRNIINCLSNPNRKQGKWNKKCILSQTLDLFSYKKEKIYLKKKRKKKKRSQAVNKKSTEKKEAELA